jgi:hypothetical protein
LVPKNPEQHEWWAAVMSIAMQIRVSSHLLWQSWSITQIDWHPTCTNLHTVWIRIFFTHNTPGWSVHYKP